MGPLRSPRAHRAALITAVLGGLALAPAAAPAATHVGTCTEPGGAAFRVTYATGVPSTGLARVTAIDERGPASPAWLPFADDWFDTTNLSSWTATTGAPLAAGATADPGPADTLFVREDVGSFHHAYDSAEGRAAVLGATPATRLQPRVTRRTTGNPSVPEDDRCDVFLNAYGRGPFAGTAAKRVAVVGDSIGVSVTARLRAKNPTRKLFQEPQSGHAFEDVLGELRGVVGGIRDGDTGTHERPDALVMELGTNDAGRIAWAEDAGAFEASFSRALTQAMTDTAAVGCRVLVTPWPSIAEGWDGDPWYRPDRLADAQRFVDAQLRDAASAPGVHLVDWAAIAAGHGPGTTDPYYDDADWIHPNATGRGALATAITSAVDDCLG